MVAARYLESGAREALSKGSKRKVAHAGLIAGLWVLSATTAGAQSPYSSAAFPNFTVTQFCGDDSHCAAIELDSKERLRRAWTRLDDQTRVRCVQFGQDAGRGGSYGATVAYLRTMGIDVDGDHAGSVGLHHR